MYYAAHDVQRVNQRGGKVYWRGFKPPYHCLDRGCVECAERRVTGRHALEQHISLLAPDLPHDHIVRILPERLPEQVKHAYLAILLTEEVGDAKADPCHCRNPVFMRYIQLPGVLY